MLRLGPVASASLLRRPSPLFTRAPLSSSSPPPNNNEQLVQTNNQSGAPAAVQSNEQIVATEVHVDQVIDMMTAKNDGDANFITAGVQDYFHLFTEYGHMPWFAAIITGTALGKAALSVFQPKIMRMTNTMTIMRPTLNELNMQKWSSQNESQRQIIDAKIEQIYKTKKFRPGVVALISASTQIPFFMAGFLCLRAESFSIRYPDLHSSSFLWVDDLSRADPWYILPLLTTASMIAMLETSPIMQGFSGKAVWIVRGSALAILPIGAFLPATAHLFWLTNNILTAAQNELFKHPRVLSFFKIPNLSDKRDVERVLTGRSVTQQERQAALIRNPPKLYSQNPKKKNKNQNQNQKTN